MIRLEDVLIYENCLVTKNFYNFLIRRGVTDYQQLKELIENGQCSYFNDMAVLALNQMEKNLSKINKDSLNVHMYPTNNYEGANINHQLLQKIDSKVRCCDLPLLGPKKAGVKLSKIENVSVFNLRNWVSKIVIYHSKAWNNGLISLTNGRRFVNDDAKKISEAINFYEQQIIRQYKEVKKNGSCLDANIFFYEQYDKQRIVEDEIKDIVEYIVDNAKVCVWGNFSDTDKLKVLTSILGKGAENIRIRRNIIKTISDYVTLSELEEDIIKTKIIDRFIVK